MTRKLNERRINYHYDIKSASKEKRQRWEDLKTDELEKIFKELSDALALLPKTQWNEWDIESLNKVKTILADRRANDVRQEIARILELSGLSYEIERQAFWAKRRKLNKINKDE